MLTAKEIRQKYLDFFARHQHDVLPSGPLIPPNDPTLLFTNAGMVQFKKFFLGEEKRAVPRVATSQKCLRVSGKHNDLENVGRTARHHTFFEMLGNFSFGDYFKKEAITWAWAFVTEELGLPASKLWVTVFRDDDEAADIWQNTIGLDPQRIVRMGEKDNFWTMGDTGPCGPCSEIYIDQGEDMACGPNCGIGQCDCDRFLEIWNLVFTQFDQKADGTRDKLACPNIDTGMGLERIAAVCQGKRSNFDCDLFQDIIQYAAELAGVKYSFSAPDTNDIDTALRVIADHARAAAFLIADGTLPSNESRGYVLRRLIRRALRFATLMGVHEPFLFKVAQKVTEVMGDAYPELIEHASFIARAVREEEQRFSQTLDKGLELLEEELASLEKQAQICIDGAFCFKLSDTYGFPIDIISDIAEKRGFTVDVAGFEKHMSAQRARARESQKKTGLLGKEDQGSNIFASLAADGLESRFVGYDQTEARGRLLALFTEEGEQVEELTGKGYAITSQTPFYGESGGQVGDQGLIAGPEGEASVTDTLKPVPTLLVHCVQVSKGLLRLDQEVSLQVTAATRMAVARNHSCTHLLHAALRSVLGTHVKQAGSLVNAQRLRFDFSHIAALTPEELHKVEQQVNHAIMADLPVECREMPIAEAQQLGAMALFGEKYGDIVRVVSMGATEEPYSRELCGGTHLSRTGQAGCFRILSENGVAAGVRRIEAVTGWEALSLADTQRSILQELGQLLKTKPDQLVERVKTLQADVKKLKKASEKAASSPAAGADLMSNVVDIQGIAVLTAVLPGMSAKALPDLMDDIRSRMPSGVACLAGTEEGKVNLVLYVSKDLHSRFTAPALIKEVAALCGGSGGGRPDLARAGGTKPECVDEALAALKTALTTAS